jgi:hypothetical protein
MLRRDSEVRRQEDAIRPLHKLPRSHASLSGNSCCCTPHISGGFSTKPLEPRKRAKCSCTGCARVRLHQIRTVVGLKYESAQKPTKSFWLKFSLRGRHRTCDLISTSVHLVVGVPRARIGRTCYSRDMLRPNQPSRNRTHVLSREPHPGWIWPHMPARCNSLQAANSLFWIGCKPDKGSQRPLLHGEPVACCGCCSTASLQALSAAQHRK